MIHHLITEKHQRHICIYCRNPATNWQSEFYNAHHYKTSICSCGRKLSIRMDFMGSGHDEWNIEHKVNQELKKIREANI